MNMSAVTCDPLIGQVDPMLHKSSYSQSLSRPISLQTGNTFYEDINSAPDKNHGNEPALQISFNEAKRDFRVDAEVNMTEKASEGKLSVPPTLQTFTAQDCIQGVVWNVLKPY